MPDEQSPKGEDVGSAEKVAASEDEEDRQGHGDDDFGVGHRDLGDGFGQGAHLLPGIEGSDRPAGAEDDGAKGAGQSEDHGVPERGHDLLILEEVFVKIQGEAHPRADVGGGGEGIGDEGEDGDVKEDQNGPNGE